jgi:serine O-acetyltransferase
MPSASPWSHYSADRARYPTSAWLYERSLWAVAAYRLQQAIDKRVGGIATLPPARRVPLQSACAVLSLAIQVTTGIELPFHTEIGPGLRIYHAGDITINPGVVIGRDCTLRNGVTLGNITPRGPTPVIGDRVEFGACSMVLGDVRIGDDATIGAMALVLRDVPAGATAVGVPARILTRQTAAPEPRAEAPSPNPTQS